MRSEREFNIRGVLGKQLSYLYRVRVQRDSTLSEAWQIFSSSFG